MPDRIPICANELTKGRTCNELLRVYTGQDGRTRYVCPRCTWREAGRCWNCGEPRTNHPRLGLYCTACARTIHYQNCKKWRDQHPERLKEYNRRRWPDGTVKRLRVAKKAAEQGPEAA